MDSLSFHPEETKRFAELAEILANAIAQVTYPGRRLGWCCLARPVLRLDLYRIKGVFYVNARIPRLWNSPG
jgi:hypothetical protein